MNIPLIDGFGVHEVFVIETEWMSNTITSIAGFGVHGADVIETEWMSNISRNMAVYTPRLHM